MSAERPLNIVICWYLHQLQYCDLISGGYELPWTYLHATTDYIDMAAHPEEVPDARVMVNFAPVLLEQPADYAVQTCGFLTESKPLPEYLAHSFTYGGGDPSRSGVMRRGQYTARE